MPGLSPFNDPMTGAQINARLAAVGLTLADDKFTVTGSADATKTFKFELDGMATGVDIVWTAGAQTADRSISLPVLTANDTLSVLGVAQTYSALKTYSAGLTVSAGTTAVQALTATTGQFTGALTLTAASTGITIAATSGTTLTISSTSSTALSSAGGFTFAGGQFLWDTSGAIYNRVVALTGTGSCGWSSADGTRTWIFGSNSGTFQVFDATASASRLSINSSGRLQVQVTTGTGLLVSSTDAAAISCSGGLSAAGTLVTSEASDSTSASTGSIRTAGGQYVAKNSLMGQGMGFGITSTATAAGTTVLTSASRSVQVFTGTTTQSVTLPAANAFGAGIGVVFIVKNRSTGAVTINRAGADTIDGAASTVLAGASNASVTLASNGVSEWVIV